MSGGPPGRVSPLTPERERLAEALAIERVHGSLGPLWIATRIGELAVTGDAGGVTRFRAITAAYEQLLPRSAR